MIYVTGDIHGIPTKFSSKFFKEQKEMNKNDVIIILGDFGMLWSNKVNTEEEYWLDWLDKKSFTTIFVDGNHENFDKLYSYPVREWNGGLVHEISPSIFHLMRGEMFNIQGLKFFAFGGASSHDIQDGIIDPENDEDWRGTMKKLENNGKYMYRIKGYSWWEEELPSNEEMNHGIETLENNNYKFDYLITHSPTTSEQLLMGGAGLYEPDIITNYLEEIRTKSKFKKHFFGHMHEDKCINSESECLYDKIIRII